MTTLLELKEKLIRFYGKNEIYVKPAIRFVLALFTFLVINNHLFYLFPFFPKEWYQCGSDTGLL